MLKRHRRRPVRDEPVAIPEPEPVRRPATAVAVDPERTEDVAAWLLLAGSAGSATGR